MLVQFLAQPLNFGLGGGSFGLGFAQKPRAAGHIVHHEVAVLQREREIKFTAEQSAIFIGSNRLIVVAEETVALQGRSQVFSGRVVEKILGDTYLGILLRLENFIFALDKAKSLRSPRGGRVLPPRACTSAENPDRFA